MKVLNRIITATTTLFLGLAIAGLSFGGSAAADCFQYNASGFPTQATPIFNNVCGVPNVGNESDFVRIRQNNAGNDKSDLHLNDFTGSTLTAACNSGDKFDLINYVHNDAYPQDNPDQNPSNPSAVAKNVRENLTAALGTNSQFTFGDTVTADNAATVSDTANLDCNGKQVQLSLVPHTVHIFSVAYGGSNGAGAWVDLTDGTVNGGPTPMGATNAGASSATSGTQWGCWNYLTVVVYEVTTTVIPPTPQVTPPVCTLLTLESSGSVARIEGLDFTNGSSTVSGVTTPGTVTGATLQFFNGTSLVNTASLTAAELQNLKSSPFVFDFSSNTGTFKVVGTVNTSLGNTAPVNTCEAVFTKTTPPTTPTVVLTSVTPPPTQLVNTGPGSMVGIFAGASAIGAVAYRWFLGRRLHRG
jgi:hypothetical protein